MQRQTLLPATCLQCGTPLTGRRSNAKFCSPTCREKHRNKRRPYADRRDRRIAYERERRNDPDYRTRKKAQGVARYAVKDRRPCEVCGDPKADKHHDDYSKPLEVRWLCRAHHMAWHAENDPVQPAEKFS